MASYQYTIEDAFFYSPLIPGSPIYSCVAIYFKEQLSRNYRRRITPDTVHLGNARGGGLFFMQTVGVRAFSHLQLKLLAEEVKSATGNWEVGQRAQKKTSPMVPGSMAEKGSPSYFKRCSLL